jgi:hypothetical protein
VTRQLPDWIEGSYFINNAASAHEKESVMKPTVSVCRKGENLYLTLEGDLDQISSQQLLEALRKLVMTSRKCFPVDSPVVFTFKTHGKVDINKKSYV